MRKPNPRPLRQRSTSNEKRRLRSRPLDDAFLAELAARVRYEGWSKHKLVPRAFGMEPYASAAQDQTYCDGHANFRPNDMALVLGWIQRGTLAGLIGANDAKSDPSIIWAVSDDGWIYEARITIPTQALYHGYPVLPNEAIAKAVLERYEEWAQGSNDPVVQNSVRLCQERYR